MKREILGVSIDDLTLDEAVRAGLALLDEPGAHRVVTPNPEFLLAAGRDESFRAVLNAADLSLADGVGVTCAAKILGRPLKGRVPGIDFAQALLKEAAPAGKRLYLLGAKPGVAERAAENLKAAHPGLTVCGVHDGYFQHDAPVAEAVRAARADIVFVCLGSPKQEMWMSAHGDETGARLLIGLGGCLDVFAGNVRRAPELWRKLGLEWLYRLIQEPSRAGRMARLPLVLLHALGERLRGK